MDKDGKPPLKQRFELKSAGKRTSKKIKRHARRIEGATLKHAHRFLLDRWDKIREVRLHIILWLGGVGTLIALVGLQMVWFQKSYIVEAPVNGGTYAEAVKGPLSTLNPLFAITPAELAASHMLFSSLYTNDTTGHLRGDIAASMTNEGDKSFTIKLRQDARWHDGEKLDADDVMYTVGLMKNPSVRSVSMASWQGVVIQQIDKYTVKFSLPAAYAAFPQALTFAIVPQHLLKSIDPSSIRESSFSSAPIGSGPFKLRLLQVVNQSTGRKIVHTEANEDYYSGRPRLNRLQLHIYPDDDSIGRAIKTGEVSAASDVPGTIANTVNSNVYDIDNHPVNSGVYALFNMTTTTLKDANVRRALQLGTDTVAIRKQIYGNPKPLYLPFVEGQVPSTKTIPAPKVSKAEAIALLEKNGWVKQSGVRVKGDERLRLRVVARKNSDFETALKVLAGQWRDLGVEVDAHVVDASDFTQEVLQQRNYDVLLDKLVIGGDPDVFAYWHTRGLLNVTSYSNEKSDDALASARTTSNANLREVKYDSFARQWLSDAPAIGLYQSNFTYIHTKATRAIGDGEKIISPDDHYANVLNWTAELGMVYKTP